MGSLGAFTLGIIPYVCCGVFLRRRHFAGHMGAYGPSSQIVFWASPTVKFWEDDKISVKSFTATIPKR
jgi:hypothetical protein